VDPRKPDDPSHYRLFVKTAGGPSGVADDVKRVLKEQGYNVPDDTDKNIAPVPIVEYFILRTKMARTG
jgi:hypothetical protein